MATATATATATEVKKIGFIGIGVMGRSMAMHLIKAGHKLQIHSRTRGPKSEEVIGAGAVWCNTPEEAAADVDVVMTMVGFPKDVEEVYFGKQNSQNGGILGAAKKGALLIDHTTTKPTLAVRIDEEAKKRGLRFLDAPVSGGDIGARNATLSLMVGGSREAFEAAEPLFRILGKTIVLQGPAGAGQHCKMCNQIAIASGMIGVMECVLYARKAGLDPEVVLQSISTGAAASWSLSNLAPRVLRGDMAPGFFVEHFIKDMEIAIEESRRMGLETPGLKLALELYREVSAMGGAKLGTQSVIKALEQRSNIAH